MLILKSRLFAQWANELKIADSILIDVIDDMAKGLYEANLGGHIFKKRISIGHRGKRGGARTIIAFKVHEKAIFMYGFSKNKKGNITKKEEEAFKALAKNYFNYNDNQIRQAIKEGKLVEVKL